MREALDDCLVYCSVGWAQVDLTDTGQSTKLTQTHTNLKSHVQLQNSTSLIGILVSMFKIYQH